MDLGVEMSGSGNGGDDGGGSGVGSSNGGTARSAGRPPAPIPSAVPSVVVPLYQAACVRAGIRVHPAVGTCLAAAAATAVAAAAPAAVAAAVDVATAAADTATSAASRAAPSRGGCGCGGGVTVAAADARRRYHYRCEQSVCDLASSPPLSATATAAAAAAAAVAAAVAPAPPPPRPRSRPVVWNLAGAGLTSQDAIALAAAVGAAPMDAPELAALVSVDMSRNRLSGAAASALVYALAARPRDERGRGQGDNESLGGLDLRREAVAAVSPAAAGEPTAVVELRAAAGVVASRDGGSVWPHTLPTLPAAAHGNKDDGDDRDHDHKDRWACGIRALSLDGCPVRALVGCATLRGLRSISLVRTALRNLWTTADALQEMCVQRVRFRRGGGCGGDSDVGGGGRGAAVAAAPATAPQHPSAAVAAALAEAVGVASAGSSDGDAAWASSSSSSESESGCSCGECREAAVPPSSGGARGGGEDGGGSAVAAAAMTPTQSTAGLLSAESMGSAGNSTGGGDGAGAGPSPAFAASVGIPDGSGGNGSSDSNSNSDGGSDGSRSDTSSSHDAAFPLPVLSHSPGGSDTDAADDVGGGDLDGSLVTPAPASPITPLLRAPAYRPFFVARLACLVALDGSAVTLAERSVTGAAIEAAFEPFAGHVATALPLPVLLDARTMGCGMSRHPTARRTNTMPRMAVPPGDRCAALAAQQRVLRRRQQQQQPQQQRRGRGDGATDPAYGPNGNGCACGGGGGCAVAADAAFAAQKGGGRRLRRVAGGTPRRRRATSPPAAAAVAAAAPASTVASTAAATTAAIGDAAMSDDAPAAGAAATAVTTGGPPWSPSGREGKRPRRAERAAAADAVAAAADAVAAAAAAAVAAAATAAAAAAVSQAPSATPSTRVAALATRTRQRSTAGGTTSPPAHDWLVRVEQRPLFPPPPHRRSSPLVPPPSPLDCQPQTVLPSFVDGAGGLPQSSRRLPIGLLRPVMTVPPPTATAYVPFSPADFRTAASTALAARRGRPGMSFLAGPSEVPRQFEYHPVVPGLLVWGNLTGAVTVADHRTGIVVARSSIGTTASDRMAEAAERAAAAAAARDAAAAAAAGGGGGGANAHATASPATTATLAVPPVLPSPHSAVLGLSWLHRSPRRFIAGNEQGVIQMFDVDAMAASDAAGAAAGRRRRQWVGGAVGYDDNAAAAAAAAAAATGTGTAGRRGRIHTYPLFPDLTSLHANCTDGLFLASGYGNNVVITDVASGALVHTLADCHRGHVNVCKFSHANPSVFATSSFDQTVKLWDLRAPMSSSPSGSGAGRAALPFGGGTSAPHLFLGQGGRVSARPIYSARSEGGVVMVCFSPDDRYLLASAVDNEVTQYEAADGRPHTRFQLPRMRSPHNYTRSYYLGGRGGGGGCGGGGVDGGGGGGDAAGAYIVSGSCEEHAVAIHSARTGRCLREVDMDTAFWAPPTGTGPQRARATAAAAMVVGTMDGGTLTGGATTGAIGGGTGGVGTGGRRPPPLSTLYVQSLRGDPHEPYAFSVLMAQSVSTSVAAIVKVNLLTRIADGGVSGWDEAGGGRRRLRGG
ncbi:hypothetical protein MMPV_002341 [Pyropia vietnamensis]